MSCKAIYIYTYALAILSMSRTDIYAIFNGLCNHIQPFMTIGSHIHCCIIQHTAVYDCIWLHMTVYGCIWMHLAVYRCICAPMGVLVLFVCILQHMVCCTWQYMAAYGFSLLYMVVYGRMDVYGRPLKRKFK